MGGSEASADLCKDRVRNPIRTVQDLRVPKPNDLPAEALQKRSSLQVGFGFQMLTAVDLHGELRLPARQIEDVRPDHMLSREARTVRAQNVPQSPFGVGGSSSERSGIRGHAWRDARHVPDYGKGVGPVTRRSWTGAALPTPQPLPACREGGS